MITVERIPNETVTTVLYGKPMEQATHEYRVVTGEIKPASLACGWSASFTEGGAHRPVSGSRRWMTIQYARDHWRGGNEVKWLESGFTVDDIRRLAEFATELADWMEANPK